MFYKYERFIVMQVKAKVLGFYGIERKRPGAVFEMANKDVFKRFKDGKPAFDQETGELLLCKWIEPLEPLEKLGVPLNNRVPKQTPKPSQPARPAGPQMTEKE